MSVISAAFIAFCTECQFPDLRELWRYTDWQILLVGKDQEKSVTELILVQHALELLTGLNNTVAIVGVDNEDDTLGVLEVMSPQRSDLVLSSDIPHGELNVLVLDGLDVEPYAASQSPVIRCLKRYDGAIPMVGIVVTISPSLSL